jgi:hypothetical protein
MGWWKSNKLWAVSTSSVAFTSSGSFSAARAIASRPPEIAGHGLAPKAVVHLPWI